MARRIGVKLAEELFHLWFNGESLWDIHVQHQNSNRPFSYRSLLRLKDDLKWEDRRKDIIEEYRRRNDEDIIIEKRKAQLSVSMLFDMINQVLMQDYKKYLADPEAFARNIINGTKKPFWLANSVFEFKELLSCQNIILNGI